MKSYKHLDDRSMAAIFVLLDPFNIEDPFCASLRVLRNHFRYEPVRIYSGRLTMQIGSQANQVEAAP